MKTLNFNLIILLTSFFILNFNKLDAQITTTSFPSKNVFELQKALGSNGNYFTLTNYMDSIINNGYLNDTSEDGNTAKYMKWDWFWNGRVSNFNYPNLRGDFSQYMGIMDSYSLSSSGCPQNQSSIQYNWELKGPVQLPTQNLGRIDVVRTLPNNPISKVAYAGASTSGLWRTNDYLLPEPIWENITDNINMPNLGISDMAIDPNNTNIAFIVGEYTGWSSYSLGLYKTTNLSSSQPTWTKVLGGPNNGFKYSLGKVLFGSNSQNVFVQRDNDIYWSTNSGNTFTILADVQNLTGNTNAITTGFILDKYNSDILYIATYEYNGSYYDGSLWKFDINNPTVITPVTLTNPATGEVKLDNGQFGTYVIYNVNNNCTQYNIDKTINSGVSWINHNQFNSGAKIQPGLPVFEVSDANENVIYLEGGDAFCNSVIRRRIIKSLDAGTNFNVQYGYIVEGNTHPDVRGIYMVNPSNDGLSDEFFVGNDGGVLYSNSSNGSIVSNLMNWENKNGLGLSITQFYGLGQTLKGEDVYAGGAQDNGMLRKVNSLWDVDISGDGYETFFKKNEPNKSFRLDGLGWNASYSFSTNYLASASSSFINDIAIGNSSCKARYFRQSIIEANDELFVSFHDVHKFDNSTSTWLKISDFTNPSFGLPDNHIIEAIAVSYQNNNTIYAGFGGPTWGANMSTLSNGCTSSNNYADTCSNCPIAKKLYKTTDGGATWLDISANFDNGSNSPHGPRWFGITDMVVSPTNDNDLWIAFDGIGDVSNYECGGVNRVTVTHDGGLTWTDYSNNLPYLPINKITYYEGTNDGLFVGTDIGVYYTDANIYGVYGWIKVSNGLPATIVSDIDINYCRGIIRIATYGRGIWEAELQPPYAENIMDITSNEIWNSDRDMITDVRIRSNVTLAINNGATINIAKDKRFIVEPGATLIIDGATLTNECGQLWGGIEVQGDATQSQITSGAQGRLEIKNNALIENAIETAHASIHDANGNPIWGTFGGIIQVDNSTIKNCRGGINFGPYENYAPNNPSVKLNDLSHIRTSDFIWDDSGNMDDLGLAPGSHIGNWGTHGIDIVANNFKNDFATTSPYYQKGVGVITIDADCRIVNTCLSTTVPCPSANIVPNRFENMKTGIQSLGINNITRVHIDGNVFDNNKTGVKLEATQYTSVIRNEFLIPVSTIPTQSGGDAFGIYSTFSYGYNFEENTFTSTGPEPINGSNYGIVSDNSLSSGGGLVYKNDFTNMVVGNLSSQDNSMLKMDCNNYTAGTLRQYDWAITSGVLAPQGDCNNALVFPAKNQFSANCTGEEHVYVNGLASSLLYSAFNTDVPVCYTAGKVFTSNCFTSNNNCLSNFTNPLSGTQLISLMNNLKTEINDNLLPLIDGSDIDNLTNIIDNQSSGNIKNALLDASPYLSDKLLFYYLNTNPPHGHLKQVILANSPVSDEVLSVINSMALPNGTRNQIINAQTGISERTLLENEISQLRIEGQRYKNEFIRLCLDNHQYQDVKDILKDEKTVADKVSLFLISLKDNTSYSDQMINELLDDANELKSNDPNDKEAEVIEKLCSVFTDVKNSVISTGSFSVLTPAVEATVQSVASSNTGSAVVAQNILNVFKNETVDRYAEPIITNASNSRIISPDYNTSIQTSSYGLNNYPNPFNNNTTIEVDLPETTNGFIIISDVMGKELMRRNVVEFNNKVEISGNELGYGIFFYSLYVNDKHIQTKKMTRIH